MKLDFLELRGFWKDVVNSARTTIWKEKGDKEPSNSWKKRILLAEHSPIRQLIFKWKWVELMYWVSVHFVRHKIGIEHFVSTQRTDRTGKDRNKSSQDALVNHECLANAQTIIYMSRKRLCAQASTETRQAWKAVLKAVKQKDPVLVSVCVPECIYRGFCPEFKSCGYVETEKYNKDLASYRAIN